MCEQFLREPSPLRLFKRRVEADNPATTLETVPRHLELVHRVHVLHVQLDARPIRRLGRPEVQVLVPPRLKVERVVARVEVGQFGQQVQVILRVELRICTVPRGALSCQFKRSPPGHGYACAGQTRTNTDLF